MLSKHTAKRDCSQKWVSPQVPLKNLQSKQHFIANIIRKMVLLVRHWKEISVCLKHELIIRSKLSHLNAVSRNNTTYTIKNQMIDIYSM